MYNSLFDNKLNVAKQFCFCYITIVGFYNDGQGIAKIRFYFLNRTLISVDVNFKHLPNHVQNYIFVC